MRNISGRLSIWAIQNKRRSWNESLKMAQRNAWFQASVAVWMRSLLIWDVTKCKLWLVSNVSWTVWTLQTVPTGCLETYLIKYQSTLRNIPEDRRSPAQKSVSLSAYFRCMTKTDDVDGTCQRWERYINSRQKCLPSDYALSRPIRSRATSLSYGRKQNNGPITRAWHCCKKPVMCSFRVPLNASLTPVIQFYRVPVSQVIASIDVTV